MGDHREYQGHRNRNAWNVVRAIYDNLMSQESGK
jgi:hypothetical protein